MTFVDASESVSTGLLLTLQDLHLGSGAIFSGSSQGPQRAAGVRREQLAPVLGGLEWAPLMTLMSHSGFSC